mmetsp:Transcript_10131/g.28295  ORF Transcript_10131/g.28295 Transcript_10131/m.28295 type:complete len:238 (-) Transcript_10131:344-1057(-)
MAAAHPFDDAFGMMKQMQGELNQIKTELHNEKTRRTSEVGELQREVRTLRGQLEQALKDLTAANDRVACALTSETAIRGRALEMLRKEVADAIHLSSEVHHLKTIQATHFGKLATELKTERHERQAGQQTLDAMLSSEVQTRTEECEMLSNQMMAFRTEWDANLREDRLNIAALVKDVNIAGQLLAGKVLDYETLGISDLATTCASSPNNPLNSTGGTVNGTLGLTSPGESRPNTSP